MSNNNILERAEELIYGDRGEDYGHPLDDFARTAHMWQAILGVQVSPEQVGLCMVVLKISRYLNKPKEDNLVDGAGYFGTIEMIKDERERRTTANVPGQATASEQT